jgi:hypothetical protein
MWGDALPPMSIPHKELPKQASAERIQPAETRASLCSTKGISQILLRLENCAPADSCQPPKSTVLKLRGTSGVSHESRERLLEEGNWR